MKKNIFFIIFYFFTFFKFPVSYATDEFLDTCQEIKHHQEIYPAVEIIVPLRDFKFSGIDNENRLIEELNKKRIVFDSEKSNLESRKQNFYIEREKWFNVNNTLEVANEALFFATETAKLASEALDLSSCILDSRLEHLWLLQQRLNLYKEAHDKSKSAFSTASKISNSQNTRLRFLREELNESKSNFRDALKTIKIQKEQLSESKADYDTALETINSQNNQHCILQQELANLRASLESDDDSENEENDDTPTIDLSNFFNIQIQESVKIDLHPIYNNNPRKYLRNKIYECQKAYHLSPTPKNKMVRIITGTGINRPGPKYRLQNYVRECLSESYIKSRIKAYWLEDQGMYNVILRKNKINKEANT